MSWLRWLLLLNHRNVLQFALIRQWSNALLTLHSLSLQGGTILILLTYSGKFQSNASNCCLFELHCSVIGVLSLAAADLQNERSQLRVFCNFREEGRLDGFHSDDGLRLAQLTYFPQASSHSRIEVVLNGVVSPELCQSYLPGKNLEISFHLLPCLRCASNSTSSSPLVHYRLLMLGSRWLCHLLYKFHTSPCIVCPCVHCDCRASAFRRLGTSSSCRTSWWSWGGGHLTG